MLGEEGAETSQQSLRSVCCYHNLTTVLLRSVVLSLCRSTDSNTEEVTCCRPHPTLFSLSDGTGVVVASAAPENSMEVLNEPGTVFHCSDELFVPLCWGESGMEKGFVHYPAENRRARLNLNDLSRALEK